MTNTNTPERSLSRDHWSRSETIASQAIKGNRLVWLWNVLTTIPEAPSTANFAYREAVRQSQLSSNVLFFFTVTVILLLPACFFTPGHAYFLLDFTLVITSLFALVLNRSGYTLAAGILVNLAGFSILTIALFTTIPFDEMTLQGYDMYVIVELLAVSLLPPRSIFLVAVMSSLAILGTLIYIPHTLILDKDLHERFLIIIARPIGTQFLVAGVAYILSSIMTKSIKRADRAEFIAQLQQELAEKKQELDTGIQQILQTHVAVANGSLQARAPLARDNMLWQIARALNNLLVRYQRAAQAEERLRRVDQAVFNYVVCIQQAEQNRQMPILPLQHTNIDPLIAALQGKTFGKPQAFQHMSARQGIAKTPEITLPDDLHEEQSYPH